MTGRLPRATYRLIGPSHPQFAVQKPTHVNTHETRSALSQSLHPSVAPMHLLQVCNVGSIVGGTAACAWTVTRALPWARHTVVFLNPVDANTHTAFAPIQLLEWNDVTSSAVNHLKPDVVLLHNTPRSRCGESLPAATLQYLHSKITPAPADLTVYCSNWLAREYRQPNAPVLYQAVPIPPDSIGKSLAGSPASPTTSNRALRDHLVVGRLCTPQSRKWPPDLPDFYRTLSAQFPRVEWEFVGCPGSQRARYAAACNGRVRFLDAGWPSRAHLHSWDALLYHHPTLTESFGRTGAEALRSGCIPILDNRGGFVEQLTSPTSIDPTPVHAPRRTKVADARCRPGFLCDTLDDFAAALEVLQHPPTRWRHSQAGRSHGHRRFSLQRFAGDFLQVLRELTDRPRRAA